MPEKSTTRTASDANSRLGQLLARAPVATFVLDPDGQCVVMTEYWRQMTGQPTEQAAAAGWLAVFAPADRDRVAQLRVRAADSASLIESDATLQAKGGSASAVIIRLFADRDPAGRILRYLGTITDIGRVKHAFGSEAAAGAAAKSTTRALLLAQLADRLAHGRDHGPVCAIHHLDLDHFNDINESAGHAIGDLALRLIGERLDACMRATDFVARYDDDAFIILQCDLPSASDAMLMADRLTRIVSEPVIIEDKRLYLTASVGTCIPRPTEHDVEIILLHAELALHRAKDEGTNTFRLYEPQIDQQIQKRASLATDLKRAIAADEELFLVYQPQVDLATGALAGVEVLVRWRHPSLGLLKPADFIPAAEKSGVMRTLGFWVLNTALRQGSKWLKEGFSVPMLTVNLSGIEARAPTLEYDIAAALLASGFPADRLELDISEITFLEATRSESRLFINLRRLGVHFAIDDFGKGYTSLRHLRMFPIDRLKIAGEFVKNTTRDRDNAAIVETAIGLSRSLGHRIAAEGIETAADADFLRAKGCETGQGFFFARPMTEAEMEPVLRQNRHFSLTAPASRQPIVVEKMTASATAPSPTRAPGEPSEQPETHKSDR